MMQHSLNISGTPAGETALAFRYLFLFRRVVVGLAIVGAVLAWVYQAPALTAALVCVGIGELLESSYYISVLRWRERSPIEVRRTAGPPRSHASTGPTGPNR